MLIVRVFVFGCQNLRYLVGRKGIEPAVKGFIGVCPWLPEPEVFAGKGMSRAERILIRRKAKRT